MKDREIKFRAKHEPTGEWHYFSLVNLFGLKDSLRYSHWSQYTGLKDKNGTEIYEGDIVKSSYASIPRVGKVIYKGNAFGIDYGYRIIFDELGHDPFHKYQEVSGNVYENPELKSKAA